MSASAGSTAPMYASMFTSSISAISTGISQSRALSAKGDYEKSVADTNAKLADIQAEQSLNIGDAEVARRNAETKRQVGSARAIQGASGVDVNSGSNAAVQRSIDYAGKIDELTIKNNAMRLAWGYKTQAIQDRFKGEIAQMTAKNESEQTLLTGGLKAISGPMSSYSDYLRFSQRYDGKQGSPATESEWEGMV